MASSSFPSIVRRASGIRRLSSSAGVGKGHPSPSDSHIGSIARTVAGIMVVGGGLWLIPTPTADSGQSFDAAAGSGFVQEKKHGNNFILGESFRRRVFFYYVKRLRLHSRPEKYFASFHSPEGELFMSAADSMRAVVPVFPPSESHIIRGHLRGEPLPGELYCDPSLLFMLFDTNSDGLISYPEYNFFVTLLSIPESNFSVAFKVFDLDNSGEIEKEEFKKIMTLMRSYNRQGACQSNGLRIGLKVQGSIEDAGLAELFLARMENKSSSMTSLSSFLRDLHDEDFALSMVAFADINHINKFLDRVDEADRNTYIRDTRITFEEFKAPADLRKQLQPPSLAIFSYGKVNVLLTKQGLKRVASQACGVPLSDNVVEVIFHIFDTNGDRHLSSEEFLRAMQRRENDIRHPTVPGLIGRLACCWSCSETCSPENVAIS